MIFAEVIRDLYTKKHSMAKLPDWGRTVWKVNDNNELISLYHNPKGELEKEVVKPQRVQMYVDREDWIMLYPNYDVSDEKIAKQLEGKELFRVHEEIKLSGTVGKLDSSDKDYRKVVLDSGGFVSLYDFTLDKCGGYKEGDRIVISIAPCGENEHYFPPRPKE